MKEEFQAANKETFKWMSVKCAHTFGADFEGANCVKHAYDIVRPFINVSVIYGAAIFCTNAAMARLAPYLPTALTKGYIHMWESQAAPIEGTEAVHVGDLFRDYLPVSDVLLALCMEEHGIRIYDFDDGGYWGGDFLPGSILENIWDPFWKPAELVLAQRPALWHKILGCC